MNRTIHLFIFCFVIFGAFTQDSTHVSDFLKDEYKVFDLENNLNENISDYYLTTPYIETAEGVIVKNEKYDAVTDSMYTEDATLDDLFYYQTIRKASKNVDFNDNIPPVLDVLPDGKYIQYYAPLAYRDEDTLKFIRNKISAVFYVKNNKVNGPAYWFLFDDQTLFKTGSYLDGVRVGKWKMELFSEETKYKTKKRKTTNNDYKEIDVNTVYRIEVNYQNALKQGDQLKTKITYYKTPLVQKEVIHFVNNIEEGNYLFSENGITMVTGSYKNGKRVGDWYFYDWHCNVSTSKEKVYLDGGERDLFSSDQFSFKGHMTKRDYRLSNRVLIEYHKINSERIYGKSVLLRGTSAKRLRSNDYFSSDENDYDNDLDRKTPSMLNTNYDHLFFLDIPLNINGVRRHYNRQQRIDSLGYIFDYLEYKRYYPNGQLVTKFKLENGCLLHEDTLFWSNGKIMNVIVFDSSKMQFNKTNFHMNGKLSSIETYDERGKFLDLFEPGKTAKERTLIKDGIVYVHQFEQFNAGYLYEFRNENTIPLIGNDTTIIVWDYFICPIHKNSSVTEKDILSWKKTTYNPGTRTVVISEKNEKINGIITTSLQYDSLFLNCKKIEVTTIGDLTISHEASGSVSSYHRDIVNTILKQKIYSHELTYVGQIQSVDVERQTLYKEKPFTGTLEILFSSYIEEPKLKNNRLTIYLKNSKSLLDLFATAYPIIHTYAIPLRLWAGEQKKNNSKNTNNLDKFIGKFENGKLHGECMFINGDHQIMVQIPFLNNRRNGTIFIHEEYPEQSSTAKKQIYYLRSIENYFSGVKNGPFFLFDQFGDTLSSSHYTNGKLIGLSSSKQKSGNKIEINTTYYENGLSTGKTQVFDTTGILLEDIQYKNQKLHGVCSFYNKSGTLFQTAFFNNDMLQDTVFTYNSDQSIRKKIVYRNNVFLKELNYKNGILTDEFINDTLEIKVAMPEKNVSDKLRKLYHSYMHYNYSNYNKTIGLMIYYDHAGNILKQGKIGKPKYLNSQNKVGIWQYNYPFPIGKYTINHVDSTIRISDSLEFQTTGEFLQKDENENLLSRRYILSEDELYNCGADETYNVLLYYVAYEKDTSLHLRNGFMKNYYPTGVKQSEGQNKDGLPNGLWKFYNDNGSLREMGHYINGKKTGRWLSGDLSKIHYMGEICFDIDNKRMRLFVEDLESKLIINEAIFVKGEKISWNSIILSK